MNRRRNNGCSPDSAAAAVAKIGRLFLAQEYFKKYKAVGAIDAFRKLRDDPEAQLLDIRRGKSVRFMASPNLRLIEKSTVQVEFDEEDEERFLKAVLAKFPDPANTVVCVLDK
ncbi:hypothetical protein GUJ93_ZPchr0001g29669 [Zizania palustris]|uniref:Uncharacterized protein n=1 Tax=Zizania palustris TaxID=103762 RepID=A0A8J5R9B6_ZIZPA|nr:hypothetical protein GUJ93_ZPchr0001g29669 [Zizania palustris]